MLIECVFDRGMMSICCERRGLSSVNHMCKTSQRKLLEGVYHQESEGKIGMRKLILITILNGKLKIRLRRG